MITGVVLARNEAANIVDCLKSLRPHVEELILIDMESSDDTVPLSAPLVDQIISHPLQANFDSARNVAIPAARHPWLWFLDADERAPKHTGEFVRKLLAERGNEFEGFSIPFKTYFCQKWIEHSGWWPGYTMPRVLKKGKFKFSERLHGGVELDGRELRMTAHPDWAIQHYSYRDIEHYVEKLNRYTSTEAGQLSRDGSSWDWRDAARAMWKDVWVYYEQNRGVQDGEEGWILAWLSGQYRWLSRAKLIDLKDAGGPVRVPSAPRDLDEVVAFFQEELVAYRRNRPQLPLGVVFRSPIADPSGYADEGRTLLRALSRSTRDLRLEEIRWSDRVCTLPEEQGALFRALSRASLPASIASVTNCIPTLCRPDPRAAVNILRTTFEADRIPANWPPILESFDRIWTMSAFDARAFVRSGVPPEKIEVVPGCVDVETFAPEGAEHPLPLACAGRFVFLSIFDWQARKGWDLLLAAYTKAFAAADGACLLLKISRSHGVSLEEVHRQADDLLHTLGSSLAQRPDVVIWDVLLSTAELAGLYRAADAFALPSRGEGFGRPFLEAMACELPTIGSASGNAEFMTSRNSFLIPTRTISVPQSAVREIPVYDGVCWLEPDGAELQKALRSVFDDRPAAAARAALGMAEVRERFSLAAGTARLESALQRAEAPFATLPAPPPRPEQVRLAIEGEFFANHSFSNINEKLALEFQQRPEVAIRLARTFGQPTFDHEAPHAHRLRSYFDDFAEPPQATIRHAFPPKWTKPESGVWIHIQPWEYGFLPEDWLPRLRRDVDEIWAPSRYVADVYRRSGIPEEKIQVIPWGVDPERFRPDAPPRILPTKKTFKFVFVGGTIARKGFDVLLEAYRREFTSADDVCLVVKDLGSATFYRFSHHREQIRRMQQDPAAPEIVYFDESMTEGQLASLYTACDCLAAPYRGEGFGLPILEAMACGLPPIVPKGGPSDDFVDDSRGFLLESARVETQHDWKLCGTPTEIAVRVSDLQVLLRRACSDRASTRRKGRDAAAFASTWTWAASAALMTERILALTSAAKTPGRAKPSQPQPGRDVEPKPRNGSHVETSASADGAAPSLSNGGAAAVAKRDSDALDDGFADVRTTVRTIGSSNRGPDSPDSDSSNGGGLAACLVGAHAERELAECLSRLAPFVDEIAGFTPSPRSRSAMILREYGAAVLEGPLRPTSEQTLAAVRSPWCLLVEPQRRLSEVDWPLLRSALASAPSHQSEAAVRTASGEWVVCLRNPRAAKPSRIIAHEHETPAARRNGPVSFDLDAASDRDAGAPSTGIGGRGAARSGESPSPLSSIGASQSIARLGDDSTNSAPIARQAAGLPSTGRRTSSDGIAGDGVVADERFSAADSTSGVRAPFAAEAGSPAAARRPSNDGTADRGTATDERFSAADSTTKIHVPSAAAAGERLAIEACPPEAALDRFRTKIRPHLQQRAEGFEWILQQLVALGRNDLELVETGCVRREDDWGAGQSTLVFDDFLQCVGGRLTSIDHDPKNCAHARGRTSTAVEIVQDDSIRFLTSLSRRRPESVDLLYLDSMDVDWNDPRRAALHQYQEFLAGLPLLRPGALVVGDDHRALDGRPGMSLYLEAYFRDRGLAPLFIGCQIAWRLDRRFLE